MPTRGRLEVDADLYSIAIWLNDNKLTLNVEKTKTMLIGSKFQVAQVKQSLGFCS